MKISIANYKIFYLFHFQSFSKQVHNFGSQATQIVLQSDEEPQRCYYVFRRPIVLRRRDTVSVSISVVSAVGVPASRRRAAGAGAPLLRRSRVRQRRQ